MRHVWHAAIAPELLQLRGVQNNANLSVKLRQVVSIRFPFSFREGEAATFVATDDDLNLAASLRFRRVVDKSLLTVLPTHLGTPTGGETDAAAWAYALGGDAFERVIQACFAPQPLGSPVAFDPQVFRLDPDQGNAAQVQAMQDEIDRLRAALAQAQAGVPPMDDAAAVALRAIVAITGLDAPRLRAHLADALNGQYARERFVLLAALDLDIPRRLRASAFPALAASQEAARLTDATGIALVCAAWAVDAWLQATPTP